MTKDDLLDRHAVLATFLAGCMKDGTWLNGVRARETWDAYTDLMGLKPSVASELLCKMLGDEFAD